MYHSKVKTFLKGFLKGGLTPAHKNEQIYSPINGEIRKLSEVDDPTFAEEVMGKGIAIQPMNGRVVAPVDGSVEVVFDTKHAIAIKSDKGAEILIHIGIDTVNLNGRYFTSHIKQGERVKMGDLMMEFDMEEIEKEGFKTIVPIIITNTNNYSDIKGIGQKEVKEKDLLLEVIV